jgi:hypothetical protein
VAAGGNREKQTTVLWCLGLVAFGLIPLGLLELTSRTGTLTGATGIFAADQLQYLSWVRDLGSHLLARNNFELAPGSHVFTDPVFGLSGGLVRLGLSPGWAYDLWLPVAALALLAAYRSYVRRLVVHPGARTAALVLALFAASPAGPLVNAAGLSPRQHNQLALALADATPALQLWGYFPIAIALGLVCLSLLALERAIDPARRRPARSAGVEILAAAAAGGLAGWLHPWQGATLLLIVLALAATERSRRAALACGATAAAVCLPLAYYYALSHLDHAWSAARVQNDVGGADWWVVPASLGPLGLFALAGVRRVARDVQERALVIWPVAALALYLLSPPYRLHALETMSLPLAILAVRGAPRLRIRAPVAVFLILLATEPGLIFAGTLLHKAQQDHRGGYALAGDDARALRAVERSPLHGGVLAPSPLASAVPAYTGRATWFGHPSWSPAYRLRVTEANRLFSGRMPATAAQRFVHSVGAKILVAPCGSSPALERLLGPMLKSSTGTGCARVLVLRS